MQALVARTLFSNLIILQRGDVLKEVAATFEIVSLDELLDNAALEEMYKKTGPKAAGAKSPKAEETAALEAAKFESAVASTEQPATDAISDSSGRD